MPAKLITRKRQYQPSGEQEQAAPVIQRPLPEADEVEPVEPGRPYQAFVESEARKYWEEMMEQPDSLVKPDQQKLRAAAMPILCTGLRKRSGARFLPPTVKAHMAVDIMHRRAADRGETKRLYKGPFASPDHIEALILFADDTWLLGREIPLPEHGEPKHPPIYYYIDPITKKDTPRDDAKICSNYVFDRAGNRLTHADYIHPWPATECSGPSKERLEQKGWHACYTLGSNPFVEPWIMFYWISDPCGVRSFAWACADDDTFIQFFPNQPS